MCVCVCVCVCTILSMNKCNSIDLLKLRNRNNSLYIYIYIYIYIRAILIFRLLLIHIFVYCLNESVCLSFYLNMSVSFFISHSFSLYTYIWREREKKTDRHRGGLNATEIYRERCCARPWPAYNPISGVCKIVRIHFVDSTASVAFNYQNF